MSNWREEYEAEQKRLNHELDEMLATDCTPEDLDKRFFKNFGCINFRSEEFFHELKLARIWHERQAKLFPEKHQVSNYDKWRCYHVTECTCGFSEACDSSD